MKVFINTDGAAGPPNPGPAGADHVIITETEDGWDSILGFAPLGCRTHHEVEYDAEERKIVTVLFCDLVADVRKASWSSTMSTVSLTVAHTFARSHCG